MNGHGGCVHGGRVDLVGCWSGGLRGPGIGEVRSIAVKVLVAKVTAEGTVLVVDDHSHNRTEDLGAKAPRYVWNDAEVI